jgi:aromatic-amino-acid transaminase
MTLFNALPPAKPDPIFGLAAAAKAAGPGAIDGTLGVYMDENGKPLLLPSVRSAIAEIAASLPDRGYGYPPLLGLPEYRSAVTRLLFGEDAVTAGIAATGGTGALAINLRMAALLAPDLKVILPVPAWVNHRPLILAAKLPLIECPYVLEGAASIEGILSAMRAETGTVAVILQTGCHNPTGLDLPEEQWRALAKEMAARGAVAMLDTAYQGFAGEPEEDTLALRIMREHGVVTTVSWSASKNHSIYGERTGFSCVILPDGKLRPDAENHYSSITRGLHSATATFGQSIVARVHADHEAEWRTDLAAARDMLRRKRDILRGMLPASFQRSLAGNGMFTLLPLEHEQIVALRETHLVFLSHEGRINIAGVPLARMEELGQKIAKVVG